HIWVGYFSFFRPHPKTGWEKEKYRSIVKELIYRTISFLSTICSWQTINSRAMFKSSFPSAANIFTFL
ncbi:MAG: hypothetical protein ACYTEN_00745, partial [Planctomycetota bacterium]